MTTSSKKFINFDGNNEKSTVRVIYILKLKKTHLHKCRIHKTESSEKLVTSCTWGNSWRIYLIHLRSIKIHTTNTVMTCNSTWNYLACICLFTSLVDRVLSLLPVKYKIIFALCFSNLKRWIIIILCWWLWQSSDQIFQNLI